MWHKHQQERKPMMEPLLLLDFDGVLNAFPDGCGSDRAQNFGLIRFV